jgi:hypothetical protein
VLDEVEKARHERNHLSDSGYEVEVLAKRTGLSRHQVFKLIQKFGRNRENLMREAGAVKGDDGPVMRSTDSESLRLTQRKGVTRSRRAAIQHWAARAGYVVLLVCTDFATRGWIKFLIAEPAYGHQL